MTSHIDAFSESYARARAKLLQEAAGIAARCEAFVEPGRGAQGEVLTMDAVHVGPPDASRALLVTSACHGVEGHAGSAAQIGILRDRRLLEHLDATGIAILIVHALNPHGFSHSRRTTAENVDLNRNVVDFERPLPANAGYRALHSQLLPSAWPPTPENERALGAAIQDKGLRAFQEIVTRGQYEFPDGIFFGGHAPTWSRKAFGALLAAWAPTVRETAWIDIHSGLGRSGEGERIFTGGGADDAHELACRWWGEVTRTDDGSSSSADLSGTLADAVKSTLGTRLVTSMTLEFGTVDPLQVLAALRADAWTRRAGEAAGDWRRKSAQAMREAFYVETPGWERAVFEQSMSAISSALKGLSGRAEQAAGPEAGPAGAIRGRRLT